MGFTGRHTSAGSSNTKQVSQVKLDSPAGSLMLSGTLPALPRLALLHPRNVVTRAGSPARSHDVSSLQSAMEWDEWDECVVCHVACSLASLLRVLLSTS